MKENKWFISALSLLLCFLFLQSSFIYASEQEEIVRVGYVPDFDLLNDINDIGFEGYGYEILKKIEQKSNFVFEFVFIDGDIFEALENNEVDIIGLFFKTPERAEKFYYSPIPLNSIQTSLVAHTKENRIYDDPQFINGKTVATYHENTSNKSLDAYLAKNNISVNYIYGNLQNYKELEADLYLAYSSDPNMGDYNNVLNLDKRHTYLLSMPQKQEMMDRISAVVYEIVTTEGNFFELLQEKYMGDSFHALHRSLTKEELQKVRQKTLKVAYSTNIRPFAYTNAQNEPDGVLIGVMNKLAELYEFDIEYLPYSFENSSALLENCDIALAITGDSAYYAKNFSPTEAFLHIPISAIIPREKLAETSNSEEVRKVSPKLGILNYLYTNFDSFIKKRAPENELVFFSSVTELLEAYTNKEIDSALISEASSSYVVSYLGRNSSFPFNTGLDLNIHLSISNDIAKEYVPLFNIMLDNISEEEYEEILIQHEANHIYEPNFKDLLLDNLAHFALIIFAILSLFFFYAYRAQTKRRNDIQHAYETDSITSFMTIYKFGEEATKMSRSTEPNTYELISFDIDMFKTINIHFGDAQGTRIILNIAKALKEVFDSTKAILCRKTGDQFLIFRPIDEGGAIQDIYKNYILPSIQEVIGESYNLSMSFGSVIIDDTSDSATSYLGKAESARLSGKDDHHTSFIAFDDKMKKYYDNKLNVTYRMKEALKDHEFKVVYQPKINFTSLEVDGAEALVRWFPKEGRTIFPDEFIPIFEQNGFILALDLYVLDEVCKFIAEYENKMQIPRISVNLSAHSIIAEGVVAEILEVIQAYGINPEKIEFELTESAVEKNIELFLQRVKELKQHNFTVSIDDFGAGVSSLNRLSAVEADVLKLDKAFFDFSTTEIKSRVVVSNVVTMAKELNMSIVAEGVETKEQALWLREINCDYAQGYYFAKPMDEDAFRELLKSQKTFNLD